MTLSYLYKSQTRLIGHFILAVFLIYDRSGQASAYINCFPRAVYKSLRVNNAVKLLSLFSWMAEDAGFHAATPVFILPYASQQLWCEDVKLRGQQIKQLSSAL